MYALMLHVWQSRVEIEHYSVVYFTRITAFEPMYCRTSIKGRAHTHCTYMYLSGTRTADWEKFAVKIISRLRPTAKI